MKIFTLCAAILLASLNPASADPAFVSDHGYISLSGEIDYVSAASNEFTLLYNGDDIEVSMDQIDEETLDLLIDSEIVKAGSYVTVTGEMEDGISGPVIKASSINVYGDGTDNLY